MTTITDPPIRLLLVEDDQALQQMLTMHFEDEGFAVTAAATCAEAEAVVTAAGAGAFDLVLLDQQLPDGQGSALLPRLLVVDVELTLVMMTGAHDLELAIEAIRQGAADFVHKPVRTEELQASLERLLGARRLARAAARAAPPPPPPAATRDLIGRSAAMLAVSKEIALGARGGATVLISGESGTGKEVVARLLHRHSGLRGSFIAVNCAAIVDTLLESELFGHERGAFTGAQARKLGKLELAAGGTLFLDEVGELAPTLQAKLLRALQERRFERVGGQESLTASARILAATNRDLRAEVAAGRFREDLAYRLRVLEIRVPPLRERSEDIPLLVDGLLARIAERYGIMRPAVAAAAMQRLCRHRWPGNVRELENCLTRAALHARDGAITPELLALPTAAGADAPAAPALRPLAVVEAEHIQRVLDHTGGHKGQTCDILGISRPALDRKIAKYGLLLPER